jgi:hypothetical protein
VRPEARSRVVVVVVVGSGTGGRLSISPRIRDSMLLPRLGFRGPADMRRRRMTEVVGGLRCKKKKKRSCSLRGLWVGELFSWH